MHIICIRIQLCLCVREYSLRSAYIALPPLLMSDDFCRCRVGVVIVIVYRYCSDT